MGQHKYNPAAIAAKEGRFSPKPKHLSKRKRNQILYTEVLEAMTNVFARKK